MGLCISVCVEGIWVIKLMVVGFSIGCGCYSGQWVPGMGVKYKKKTVLHSFRELPKLCSENWSSSVNVENKVVLRN